MVHVKIFTVTGVSVRTTAGKARNQIIRASFYHLKRRCKMRDSVHKSLNKFKDAYREAVNVFAAIRDHSSEEEWEELKHELRKELGETGFHWFHQNA